MALVNDALGEEYESDDSAEFKAPQEKLVIEKQQSKINSGLPKITNNQNESPILGESKNICSIS